MYPYKISMAAHGQVHYRRQGECGAGTFAFLYLPQLIAGCMLQALYQPLNGASCLHWHGVHADAGPQLLISPHAVRLSPLPVAMLSFTAVLQLYVEITWIGLVGCAAQVTYPAGQADMISRTHGLA